MTVRRVLIALALLNLAPFLLGHPDKKCCPTSHNVVRTNATFSCRKSDNRRIQTKFLNVDFVSLNKRGRCSDVLNGNETAVFDVNDKGDIFKFEPVQVDSYPKCCPLGYVYNVSERSCQPSQFSSKIDDFIPTNSFVSIGLPRCQIISDTPLLNVTEVELEKGRYNFQKNGKRYERGNFCVDVTTSDTFVVRTCEDYDFCKKTRCIRKCCQDGQSFVNGSKCSDTFVHGVNVNVTKKIEHPEAPSAVMHGMPRPVYILKEKSNFRIDEKGTFWIYSNKTDTYSSYEPSEQVYCIEHAFKPGRLDAYAIFSRAVKPQLQIKFAVTRWIKIVSCLFLFLTMGVYLMLPKMLNLFGKILLSYSFATFLFFFFLCLSQFLSTEYNDFVCKFMGFLTIMASFWSFTWLNIMCIDIWVSFGNPRTFSGPLQRNELKKLIQYSVYGWGVPFLWVLVIIVFNTTTALPRSLHPYVGYKKCYMENTSDQPGNYAYNVFITFPVLLQQIANVVLFVKTLIYCLRIRGEIQRMNESSKKNYRVGKEELNLVMKLAVIMGVSFIFETVSSMYDFSKNSVTRNIEVWWDAINCSQGIFIFVVFICKRKIFNSLMEKWDLRKPCKYDVTSSLGTQDSLHTFTTLKRDTIVLNQK